LHSLIEVEKEAHCDIVQVSKKKMLHLLHFENALSDRSMYNNRNVVRSY